MSTVNPVELTAISKAVLAAIRRDGRLPARLDEEDYNDLVQEGLLAALSCLDRFDPQRGNLRAYLNQPIARAQLKEAWRMASVGITGDHSSLQVWSTSDTTDDEIDVALERYSPDVADEIEAFDHVWQTRYNREVT